MRIFNSILRSLKYYLLHFTPCLHSFAECSSSVLNKHCVCTQDIKTLEVLVNRPVAMGQRRKRCFVFFQLFTRQCASSPDQPRQQKPVCRFPIDHLSPLFTGSTKGRAYFSRVDVDTHTRTLTHVPGTLKALRVRLWSKNVLKVESAPRGWADSWHKAADTWRSRSDCPEPQFNLTSVCLARQS